MILYQMKGGHFLFVLLLPPLNYDLKMKYVSMGYLLIGTNTNNSQPLRFTYERRTRNYEVHLQRTAIFWVIFYRLPPLSRPFLAYQNYLLLTAIGH